ncbi:hypothetical protein C4802_03070 [Salmonella enterica subsp. enterica serovar Rubislaw]|nr:hypothetical protein C4802_03070 [Salmonella enterica subsp. enterica serovar Rubislaw]
MFLNIIKKHINLISIFAFEKKNSPQISFKQTYNISLFYIMKYTHKMCRPSLILLKWYIYLIL